MATQKSIYNTLSSLSIKGKVERKGNLDYLSWANAWAMLKEKYPNAQRTVYEHDHTGLSYFTDGRTAYVKVGITINDLEHIDMLPVMDFRNNSISVDGSNSILTVTGQLINGMQGDNNKFNITDGGSATIGTDLRVGFQTSASGNQVNISGTNSTLTVTRNMLIGEKGSRINSLWILKAHWMLGAH